MPNGNNTTNIFAVGDIIKLTTDGILLHRANLPMHCGGWVVKIIEISKIYSQTRYVFRFADPYSRGYTDTYYSLICGIERKF